MKHMMIGTLVAVTCAATGQHTVPNTWTALYGASQGWPQDRDGRAIHMVHVPPLNPQVGSRGAIIFWGRSNNYGGPVTPTKWIPPMAWETSNGTFSNTSELDYEAFCCGQTLMEDGKIVITGSHFRPDEDPEAILVPGPEVATYSLATNSWTKSPQTYELNRARYYPTTIRMPGGKIITLGGQATLPPEGSPIEATFVDEPFEINPNSVNVLATWSMPIPDDWDFLNYPHVFPVSATELFFAGPARHNGGGAQQKYRTFVFDTSSDAGPTNYGGFSETWHGSSIMYRPGLILKTGGVTELATNNSYEMQPATAQSETINVTSLSTRNLWQFATSMNNARIDHNLVVLPNGKVMALGGATRHHMPYDFRVISCEIWNPVTNTWSLTASPADVFRGYHATAMLMPDGRVLSAGGDAGFPNEHLYDPPSGQIYLPDYGTGTRPEIVSAPDQIQVGSTDNSLVVNDASVSKAVLIGLGAVTHSFDSNQRYIELDLSTNIGTPTIKSIAGPTSTTQAPYGWYMLFVLKPDGNGNMLPCKMAKYIKVVPPTPN